MSTISASAASLAASKSAVFASAPPPQQFGIHQQGRIDEEENAIRNFAAQLIRSGLNQE